MRNFHITCLFITLFVSLALKAEIDIDGLLDEPEWQEAITLNDFYEVYPYSLRGVKDFKTQILIIESKEGLYFGFKNYQPNESMRTMNHLRDQERALSDKNGIVIDFNGDGVEGYNFFISSSGSIGDATVTDEKERNWDWDADWQSAASIQDGVWYSETFIPWSIASMKEQAGEKRKIRMAFYRMLMGIGRGFSTIKGSVYENVYLSVFDDFEFNNYSGSKLDFFH